MKPKYRRTKARTNIRFVEDSRRDNDLEYAMSIIQEQIQQKRHLRAELHRVSREHLLAGVLIGQGLSIAAFYLGLHWTVLQP